MSESAAGYSDDFRETAREEAQRLRAQAASLRAEGEKLAAQSGAYLSRALAIEQRVRELDELLGQAPQLTLEYGAPALRGQRLRDEAVRILASRLGVKSPIHYRVWYALLEAAGARAGGRDPLATFLTEISRSPLIERVNGEVAGTYQLNPDRASELATARISQAARLVREAEVSLSSAATPDEASALEAELRSRRRELARAQRALERIVQTQVVLLSDPAASAA